MAAQYTFVEGLSFPKGSDREYIETWDSLPDKPVLRKTIDDRVFLDGKEGCMLTITGSGDVLPVCALSIGDTVTINTIFGKTVTMRFKAWNYKHLPWQFSYNWSYSFVEMDNM
jgi:hypothetical protein